MKHSSQLAYRKPSQDIPVQKVMSISATIFGISLSMMNQHRRLSEIIKPKHISILLIREYLCYSLQDTAELFGLATHASVIHACRQVRDRYATNVEYRGKVIEIIEALSVPVQEACITMNLKALKK